nr:glutamine amidotransferase [Corynebacterium aquatimens]
MTQVTTPYPFLLLSTRPEDAAASEELDSFTRAMQVPKGAIEQHRLEQEPLGRINLDDYSGILLGGSPFNNLELMKSPLQLRVEREIGTLIAEAIDRDFPVMGACYGIGAIGTAIGARVSDDYAEEAGMVQITVTDDGVDDPLFEGVSHKFDTIVGHKEALHTLPDDPRITILATGEACPIQMFRVGQNVYATQFHPELRAETLEFRLRLYAHLGYTSHETFESQIAHSYDGDYTANNLILKNFADRYRR